MRPRRWPPWSTATTNAPRRQIPTHNDQSGAMTVLVLDFGSQVTQLIARRVREAGVYCEIVPYNKADAALVKKPRAIILSGGPASVTETDTPRAPQQVFEMGVPVLGICYGEMTMAAQLGGKVEAGHNREF